MLKTGGLKPESMDSHTAVLLSSEKVLVFGGYVGSRKSNKLYTFTLTDNTWKEIKAKGSSPSPRSDHSAVIFEGKMIIFGGINADGEKLEDLWILDTAQETWKNIPAAMDIWPRPRSGHIATMHNGLMYMFGGTLNIMQETNDFFTFNPKDEKWDIVHAAEKMISEEERTSPITALKVKRINDEAKKKQRGESSPMDKGYSTVIKLRQDKGKADSSLSPKFSMSSTSPMSGRKTYMKRSTGLDNIKIDLDDEVSSPIVAVMRNSIVMKAISSDKKKTDHDIYSAEGSKLMVGKFPCGRDGHAGGVYNDKLYVFGGDRCQMAYNDFFAFPLT